MKHNSPPPHEIAAVDERIDGVISWFTEHGHPWIWRTTRDRWVVLVSEVCLQQTQISRAADHVARILERFPTAHDMADSSLTELLGLWQGLGYPRRAKNLHAAAQIIASTGWPENYRELPGVGEYTDAALRCFADEEPVLPPDINTRRVTQRLFPEGTPEHHNHLQLAAHPWSWGQGVMELGQRYCKARARCSECPLASLCPSVGTTDIVASPRQKPYVGSMRQRRGVLLKALTSDGEVRADTDRDAAESLVADGLANIVTRDDAELLVPVEITT